MDSVGLIGALVRTKFFRGLCMSALGALLSANPLAHADVVQGAYVGSSKTTVKYLNPATLAVLKTESFARKAKVSIVPPKVSEPNPFGFAIAPYPRHDPATGGDLFAASARTVNVQGTDIVLQYWDVQETDTGFAAFLINNHIEEGVAKDRVMAFLGGPGGKLRPFFMHDARIGAALQSRISATATDRKLVVNITGYAFIPSKAIIQFTTKINGRRP
jgi:hypothetical protein